MSLKQPACSLHCPLCGESLTVRSPTLCTVVEKHALACRKATTAVDRRDFVIAAPPPDQAAQHLHVYHREVLRLHGTLADANHERRRLVRAMERERTEHARADEASTRETATLRTEIESLRGDVGRLRGEAGRLRSEVVQLRDEAERCRSRPSAPQTSDTTGSRLVCALRRIAASKSRRRKLLALLHPDLLKDPTLCSDAKFVRESVQLE